MSDTTGPSMRAIMSRHIGLPSSGLRPPVGDAGAADERDVAVDDEQLAVGAVVQPAQAVPREPLVDARRGSRPPRSGFATLRIRAEAADRVHHDRHAHAGARPLAQRLDELVADLALA